MKMVMQAMLTVGLLSLSAGCGPDAGSGSLRVRWVIGGTTCESADVKDIAIHLLDGDVDILEASRTYGCGSGVEGVLIEGVPAGSYEVVLDGLDSDGNAYYSGTLPDRVEVPGDQETVLPVISLELKKALILLTWKFTNGDLCTKNGVARVEVNVFDTTSNNVYRETFDCDPFKSDPKIAKDGGILIEGLRGNDDLSFDLFGLDSSDARIFRGKAVLKTIPGGLPGGEPQELLISLSQCVDPSDCI
ncbi:MAG: hypothetical protein GXP54_10235 [Deltaproteobacteria bacterium]|nr:hypothetical protein [Deltaproteobacteria bacterium]